MAKKSVPEAGDSMNKSEEIRKLLAENPKIKASAAVTELADKGVTISVPLFYFVKGQMNGKKKSKAKKAAKVAKVSAATHTGHDDAVSLILKVKTLANEVGGLERLKSIITALSA